MQDWPYAVLAKEASLNGGPDHFLDLVREAGIAEGRIQGGLGAFAISLVLITCGYAGFRMKQRAIGNEIAMASEENQTNDAAQRTVSDFGGDDEIEK